MNSVLSVYIVIPAYNEATVIQYVIDEIQSAGDYRIIIVDDGSKDNTGNVVSKNHNVLYLRHKLNRGKGAATKTGIMAANMMGAGVVVTMDGDGQHDPADIERLIQPIRNKDFDVVLGSRLMQTGVMPPVKVVANKFGNFFTWLFYGILVSDSQSGFRAYSKYAANIIDTKADKYEYDSKVIREVKNNRLLFTEVPISVRYTEYSMGKVQKQGFVNGLKTLYRMIWHMIV